MTMKKFSFFDSYPLDFIRNPMSYYANNVQKFIMIVENYEKNE